MIRLSEEKKILTALEPVSLATTNQTGQYLRAGERNSVICTTNDIGTVAGNETAVFLIWKATDGIGTGGVTTTTITKTITAATKAQKLNILMNAPANGKYITINGNTYTMAAAYSLANKEFDTIANLVILINAVDSELYAVAIDGTHLSVEARDPGTVELTDAANAAGWEAAKLFTTTMVAQALLEFEQSDLGVNASGVPYNHFAVKCTTTATIVVGAVAVIDNNDLVQPVTQNCEAYLI